MLWQNLKKIPAQCPNCDAELEFITHGNPRWICSNVMDCDFSIGKAKFEEIVNNMVDEDVFSGECEVCGKRINPRYRLCRNCDN